jgi:NAD-dependent DNA ligase
MTWKDLENQGRVEPYVTSKAELDDLRAALGRNLADAAIRELSADNRFSIAYQAALLAAKMAVSCAGYRVKGQGAHQTTFQAVKLALGTSINKTADYLDRCRRKRNDLAYDSEGVVSATDAVELLQRAKALRKDVEAWIAKHHPKFV